MKRIYNGVEVTYQNETDYNQSNVVYLITFPDGKYYVGSTTQLLCKRVISHCVFACTFSAELFVSKAIREYNQFKICVLGCEMDTRKLRKLEAFYTTEYNSNDVLFGYNKICGNMTQHTIETKEKMSITRKGKKLSDITKNKISSATKGKKRTMMCDEQKNKISQTHKKIYHWNQKTIKDDHGNIFISVTEAGLYYNVCTQTVLYYLKTGRESKTLLTRFYLSIKK